MLNFSYFLTQHQGILCFPHFHFVAQLWGIEAFINNGAKRSWSSCENCEWNSQKKCRTNFPHSKWHFPENSHDLKSDRSRWITRKHARKGLLFFPPARHRPRTSSEKLLQHFVGKHFLFFFVGKTSPELTVAPFRRLTSICRKNISIMYLCFNAKLFRLACRPRLKAGEMRMEMSTTHLKRLFRTQHNNPLLFLLCQCFIFISFCHSSASPRRPNQ